MRSGIFLIQYIGKLKKTKKDEGDTAAEAFEGNDINVCTAELFADAVYADYSCLSGVCYSLH